MHVLFVSIAFPPKKDPECLQTAKYFKYLSRENIEISVVTSTIPTLNMDYDPSLEGLDIGYLQKLEYPLQENKYVNFLIRKLFPATLQTPDSKKKFIKNWRRVVKELKKTPDIIYSRSFPLSSALTAQQLKFHYNIPWVMHLSDPWADAPWVSRKHGIYEKNKKLERSCFESADKISFTTRKAFDFYSREYPQFIHKYIILPNVFDEEELEPTLSPTTFSKLRIVYTGGMSGNRGPEYIINVVEHLRNKGFNVDEKIELILAGEADRKNLAYIEGLRFPYVKFVGRKSYRDAKELQKSAHLLLIFDEPLKDVSHTMFFPSKILDYLVAGKKMFAITSRGSEVDLTFKKYGWPSFSHDQLDEAAGFLEIAYQNLDRADYFKQIIIPDDFSAKKNAKRLVSLMETLWRKQ